MLLLYNLEKKSVEKVSKSLQIQIIDVLLQSISDKTIKERKEAYLQIGGGVSQDDKSREQRCRVDTPNTQEACRSYDRSLFHR